MGCDSNCQSSLFSGQVPLKSYMMAFKVQLVSLWRHSTHAVKLYVFCRRSFLGNVMRFYSLHMWRRTCYVRGWFTTCGKRLTGRELWWECEMCVSPLQFQILLSTFNQDSSNQAEPVCDTWLEWSTDFMRCSRCCKLFIRVTCVWRLQALFFFIGYTVRCFNTYTEFIHEALAETASVSDVCVRSQNPNIISEQLFKPGLIRQVPVSERQIYSLSSLPPTDTCTRQTKCSYVCIRAFMHIHTGHHVRLNPVTADWLSLACKLYLQSDWQAIHAHRRPLRDEEKKKRVGGGGVHQRGVRIRSRTWW